MDARSPLSTFLCVYRHGSQSKAAAVLHLTQPAVSQQLKFLEERFGKPLFKRAGRKLVPTPAAHQLALQISKPLDSLEQVWNSLKLKSSSIQTIQLGGIREFYSSLIVSHLSELSELGIHCRFTFGHDSLVERLLEKEIDIAQFCAHVAHPGIEIEKFFTEEFVLVGHPKWKKTIANSSPNKLYSCLNSLPWIAYDESLLFIKEYFLTVFNEPFDGSVPFTIPDLWTMLNAVIGGCGITILPSYFCKEALLTKKVVVLAYPKNPPKLDFYLGWKDGALQNSTVKTVKCFLQKIANQSLPHHIVTSGKKA